MKEQNKLLRGKDRMKNDFDTALKELKDTTEIKCGLETKLKEYERELSEQKAKTETALKDLCKNLALT